MSWDSRRITLDSGLVALALRARRNPRESYPFVPARSWSGALGQKMAQVLARLRARPGILYHEGR